MLSTLNSMANTAECARARWSMPPWKVGTCKASGGQHSVVNERSRSGEEGIKVVVERRRGTREVQQRSEEPQSIKDMRMKAAW